MPTPSPQSCLPEDLTDALLVGRLWRAAPIDGPCVIVVRDAQVVDISAHCPTVADLLDKPNPAGFARQCDGTAIGTVDHLIGAALVAADESAAPSLLAPCDVQAIKACGVTFAISLLERVIEEQARGDPAQAHEVRQTIQQLIGTDLSRIVPGSAAAQRLKAELQRRNAWSQYLEVGIGPDAEVFTKAQPMSALGFATDIGLHPSSSWNNPEPEIVLAVDASGRCVGATLGNDVNLRDIEGRSALLLGKAKDNNGSCAIGPFIRLFDDRFNINDIRSAQLTLTIEGLDGFTLRGASRMSEISRDPLDLVAQTAGPCHQYPDGFMLFLGTMFSPTQDRDTPGGGFTHHRDDRVTIYTPRLGALVNRVRLSDEIAPWRFGVRALYANLAQRGLAR